MTSGATVEQGFASLDEEPAGHDYVMDRMDWYRELLAEDPSSMLFCELAEEQCREGLWEEAVRTLRQGLHFHPRHIRAHALLGWALWEHGSAEQAEEVLDQVRRELEKSAVVYRVLGEISTHRGDLEEAARMESIYSLMLKGGGTSDASPRTVESSPRRPFLERPADVKEEPVSACERGPTEPVLVRFLTALKDRMRRTGPSEPQASAVFTAADRKALERLIRAHAGGL